MYHSRVRRTSWLFANSGSIRANGTVWNARSHAANQGYSHGSGIEITSAMVSWGASPLRRETGCVAVDDRVVKGVLDGGGPGGNAPQPLGVRLILGKEELRITCRGQPRGAEGVMLCLEDRPRPGLRVEWLVVGGLEGGSSVVGAPRPGVAEPERRQEMDRGGLGAAVRDGDPDRNVVLGRLRVFDFHVEVAVVVEDAGVGQLVLGVLLTAPGVLDDELRGR